MSFPWSDYLTVAEALIQARNTFAPAEARYRAAISRAYYAAYGATRNYARAYEGYIPVPAGRDHGLVAEHYLAGTSRTHHKIGQTLQRLLIERHRADLLELLKRCRSGQELMARGFEQDVLLAAAHGVSACVPTLVDGAYVHAE